MDNILFDLDGTLIDSAPSIVFAFQQTFLKFGLPEPKREFVISKMGVPIEQVLRDLGENFINDEIFDEVLKQYRALYLEICPTHLQMFSGIRELIECLHNEKKNLLIVTSKRKATAEKNCAQFGIEKFFIGVVGSDSVLNHKPHPEPVYTALKLLPDPVLGKTIVVGDSTFDIEMGNAAGVPTCAVTWGSHSEEELLRSNPSYLVRTTEDLKNLLLNL